MSDQNKRTSEAPEQHKQENLSNNNDEQAIQELQNAYQTIRKELSGVIIGQERVLEELLVALFAGGHCILEGVPGLAKTLMISTLARSLDLSFSRIQFTPDLMPADITGTEVLQEDKSTGSRTFRFLPGPVFANVVLADEINRTPPKTQSALLEAMQERQVTVGGKRHRLEPPFFVLATQNPIEQEGTYPLPEAQQDRFMSKVFVQYPSYEEEMRIAELTGADITEAVENIPHVLDAAQVLQLQQTVRRIPAAKPVVEHALNLARKTRPDEENAPELVRQMINWGAGPRAVQFMLLAGRARAALNGRCHVAMEDVRAVAHPVLRHRIVTNFSAEAEGYTTDRIIDELLQQTPADESALSKDARLQKILES
jgi:MoxR-like ATPase